MKAFGGVFVRGLRAAGRMLGWTTLSGGGRMANERDILELLGSNSRLGSPVDAIATDVSMVPWVVKKRVVNKGKVSYVEVGRIGEGHNPSGDPLIAALNSPTARLNWSAWIYVLTTYQLACGYAPIWVQDRDELGRPRLLQPVAPADTDRSPSSDADGNLFFWVTEDRLRQKVLVEDLLWAFRVDPANPRGPGLGKARGVEDDVAADEAMAAFNSAYFKNGAVLGPVVNIPGADLGVLEKEWAQERKGVVNFHKPLLTNAEQAVQVVNTSPTMKDLAMADGRKLGRDFIFQAFHMSPVRVGVMENTTRAAIEGSDFHQQKNCVLPELIYWREFFNQHIVSAWGEDYYLDFTNPVKETAEFHRQLADTGIRGGWITVNEARDMHGLPELQGGNMLLIPVNNVIMLDVSNGIKVPDIATQLRMNGGQKVDERAKAWERLREMFPPANDPLIESIEKFLKEGQK